MIFFSMGGCTLGKFNSMGGGHMNLSDYMGGRGLWKFYSMGGGVEKKVPSSPPRYFFSGIALTSPDNLIELCHRKPYFRSKMF